MTADLISPESEVYRENCVIVVDGIKAATAKDERRAGLIVRALQQLQMDTGALEYVRSAIASFGNDPADSDYQRGYLAALECVAREAFGQAS